MTITLKPETEARLRERAERDGADMNAIADALVVAGLGWEAREQAEAAESLRRALAESDAGKVRLFSEVAAGWRAKYNLPTHLSGEELLAGGVTALWEH
jgi:predicted transcriptional regulator